ncbi:MAG TPA: 5-(carboxyamino)imidazole ribonucleotide synthase [Caulobacteraceae bacterium]|jgi:5-(carboxyamino)imidazole ribonucleotide synthase
MSPFPLPPGSTIGILGGGQLGRMLAMAAARLGFDVAVLDPEADCPAGRVAAHTITAAYGDPDGLTALAEVSDVVTFEFENVPAEVVEALQKLEVEVAPGAKALAVAQDRFAEKTFLNGAGIRTAAFADISGLDDLRAAMERLGLPALLKTRREGYDGKGQVWIGQAEDAEAALTSLRGRPAILEAKADFVRELSVIAARGRGGEFAAYPLGENRHEGGILRRTVAPADASDDLRRQAEDIARALLDGLDYVGVIGVELFELDRGELLVNEFAPRVHNSGHWTLDGCQVDQFEQHVRAVAGWPFGPTAALARTEMLNLIDAEADAWRDLSSDPAARLWLYGKRESRPGRKMGHVNRLTERS